MANFTAQTNLVVWIMTPMQLRDLKHFDEMKSIGKIKLMKSIETYVFLAKLRFQNYFSQILFDSVIFIQILPRAVRESIKCSSTFSATNFSSNIVWLLQLHDAIQMESIYCYQIQ